MLHLNCNTGKSGCTPFFSLFRKVSAVVLCLNIICHSLSAQTIQNTIKDDAYTPGRLLDTVVDNMGNKYTLRDILINSRRREKTNISAPLVSVSDCSSGYFKIYMDEGCGIDGSDPASVARRQVLCQVLSDISQFINSPLTTSSTGQKINISVRSLSSLGLGASGFAGVASSFYNLPSSATISGIADNTMWITLISGTDAYQNVASPLLPSDAYSSYGSAYFHGMIAFQFNGSINWHTDLTSPTGPGERDLYSVMLHEMLHALGFVSLIDYNGNSRMGSTSRYFSRYDQHLQTSSGTPLITNTGTCGLYNWGFNPTLVPSSVLSPGSTSATCPSGYQTGPTVDHTVCANAIIYSGGTTQKVYTPSCYEKGSSLSHFEDECQVPAGLPLTPPASNNQYFVMSNSNVPGPYSATANPGAMKRYPTAEERKVLCDIGYEVNTTFGNSVNLNHIDFGGTSCPGAQVAGINDGITPGGTYTYFTTAGTAISINGGSTGSILDNDHGAASFKCLEVVSGSGSLSATTGTSSTMVSFTPAAGAFGAQLLRYIPVSAAGAEGNITYIYIYVGDADCTPTTCDLVANGGFESIAPGGCCSVPGYIHCWSLFSFSPDLISRGITGCSPGCVIPCMQCVPSTDVHSMSSGTNDHFVGLWAFTTPPSGIGAHAESIQSLLTSSVITGQAYTVSFWAKLANNTTFSYSTHPTYLQFALSPSTTPLAPAAWSMPALPAGLDSLCSFLIIHPDSGWHHYSRTVTYTGATGNTLAIMNAMYLDDTVAAVTQAYILIDDISIKPAAAVCSFTLPPTLCRDGGYLDLNTTISIPGGTFQWYRDSSNVRVTTDSSWFDPHTAYDATYLAGGDSSGIVTVSYTYTDILGCTQTVFAETHIHNATSAITGTGNICLGLTTTLANTIPNGIWVSNYASVASVDSATGVVTGVSAGTAVISYLMPGSCPAIMTVTVDPMPITGSTSINIGASTTLSSSTTGGSWSISNASVATINVGTGVVTGLAAGTDTVTYTTAAGCTTTVIITVLNGTNVNEPYAQSACALSLVPNPNKGTFTITGTLPGITGEKEATVVIFDLMGRVVYKDNATIKQGALNKKITAREYVHSGMYIVRLVTDDVIRTLKFTVE